MREILFRGKREDCGEWKLGSLCEMFDGYHICDTYGTADRVIPETVGQYTGLTDKNGNKIFEGDIVKAQGFERVMLKHWGMKDDADYLQDKPEYELYQIKFNEGKFQLFTFRNESGAILNWGQNGDATTLEVIGNIHDNPELLEVEK